MKHKIFMLLFSIASMYTNAFAQPHRAGQKAIGGKGYDEFSSMYLTEDGGLMVGGSS